MLLACGVGAGAERNLPFFREPFWRGQTVHRKSTSVPLGTEWKRQLLLSLSLSPEKPEAFSAVVRAEAEEPIVCVQGPATGSLPGVQA